MSSGFVRLEPPTFTIDGEYSAACAKSSCGCGKRSGFIVATAGSNGAALPQCPSLSDEGSRAPREEGESLPTSSIRGGRSAS